MTTLPTFFIIGAAKCGTTSLHRYCAEHPEIAMSSEKEPMCFEPPHWEERLAEYDDLFEEEAGVRGEASTAYAAYPWVPEIPDRIKATVPDALIIYCVRDPVDRMLAHYAQFVWDRMPIGPFDKLMDNLEDPMNMPVWISRYATQYERWVERFGADRVLVLEQRDLLTNRDEVMRRVFTYLGVDPGFTSPRWDEQHNTAGEHRMPTDFARRLGRHASLAERIPGLRSLVRRPVPKPAMTPEQHGRVLALLKPEAERFQAMTGIAIDHWKL